MSVHWGGRGPGHLSRLTSVVTTFSPLSLIPAAWYDPSDLSTLFQDTAGTTPVTAAGQSVALIKDKSGNGFDLSQATAANCPTYQLDGGGLPYLSFDGVNDRLFNVGGIGGLTATVGLAGLSSTGSGRFLWANTPSSSNRQGYFLANASGISAATMSTGSGSAAASGTGIAGAQVAVAVLDRTIIAAPTAAFRENGVDQVGTTGSFATANIGAFMGSATNSTSFFAGRVYGLVHVAGTITTQQRSQLETYLGTKCGVIL